MNMDTARFCSQCGAKLEEAQLDPSPQNCTICGRENPPGSKYCAHCGEQLRISAEKAPRHRPKSREAPRRERSTRFDLLRWHPAVITAVILASAAVLIFATQSDRKAPSPPPRLVEQTSGDAALEGKVLEIASKFICSCGSCGQLPLETCTCDRAIEQRQFIRKALQEGEPKERVVQAVQDSYGWMKPEFAAQYDSTARTGGVSTKLTVPIQTDRGLTFPQTASGTANIATSADRIEIFSHFRCPCGQCGIDELKDCTCDHPKGAQEVKSFVDGKIAEGKYTVAQLVGEVERKYGGRKFYEK